MERDVLRYGLIIDAASNLYDDSLWRRSRLNGFTPKVTDGAGSRALHVQRQAVIRHLRCLRHRQGEA